MSFAPVDLEALVMWCLSSFLALILFLPSLLEGLPERKDFVETSCLVFQGVPYSE